MKRTLVILLVLLTIFPAQRVIAAEPRCSNTLIASPAANSTVSSVVNITGRAQLEGAFVRYQVDFSTTGLNLWVLLNSAPQAVVDGTLARWDTTLIPDGTYDLRVRTVDTSGNYCEEFESPVFVKQGTGSGGQTLLVSSGRRTTNISVPAVPSANVIEIESLNGKLTVEVPRAPYVPYCTPAYALGAVVARSVRLCAGQTYRPFTVTANNVAVVGDTNRSAVIHSEGRSFGIRVRGSNVLIAGVRIIGSTAASDAGNWLCLYEQCGFSTTSLTGGATYGGGILLEGSGNVVMNSNISGGVIGIASLNGRGNKFISNELVALSGWGFFAVGVSNSAFIANTLHDVNRTCTDPGGQFFAGGCESAGLLLMGADANLIANNTCARSGNCYYLNGEGGRLNNFNKLYGNSCAEPSYNCFEITDAQGIEFENNSAALAPDNGSGCDIWLVRAQIIAGANNRVNLCNHRGSHLESTYDPPK